MNRGTWCSRFVFKSSFSSPTRVSPALLNEQENVLEQLRIIIVSSLIERMRIPIPTLHMDDKDMEYTVRNLVVAIRYCVSSSSFES